MELDIDKVGGIGEYIVEQAELGSGDDAEKVTLYKVTHTTNKPADESNSPSATAPVTDGGPKTFLVIRKNTLEVRTDAKLKNLLRDKYESVMESRYFGRGGIEIVNSGQLAEDELYDLIRLSYRLSAEQE